MIRRRDFLALTGAATLASPLRALAQSVSMKRLALIVTLPKSDPSVPRYVSAVTQGLLAEGWVDGRNLQVDTWYDTGESAAAARAAKAAVGVAPNVLVTLGPVPGVEAKNATSTIPIVAALNDLIGAGLVRNPSHPDANVTGFTLIPQSIGGKYVDLLHEIAPGLKRIGWLQDTKAPSVPAEATAQEAARAAGIEFVELGLSSPDELVAAIGDWGGTAGRGLIVTGGSFFASRHTIATEVAKYALPAVFSHLLYADEGVAVAFAADPFDLTRRAGEYAGLILNGKSVSDLPVQDPTKFTLIVNLKTAKQQGIAIPQSLLARADQVIS